VTRTAHISTQWHTLTTRFSLPIHIQHHHTCSSVENNILSGLDTVVGETWLWCLILVRKAGTSFSCIFIKLLCKLQQAHKQTNKQTNKTFWGLFFSVWVLFLGFLIWKPSNKRNPPGGSCFINIIWSRARRVSFDIGAARVVFS